MSASAAVGEFMAAEDAKGWEVVIPRRIEASEIHRVRQLPQVIGWRFSPGAKGKPPFCPCKFCTRGEYGSQRLRERLGELAAKFSPEAKARGYGMGGTL